MGSKCTSRLQGGKILPCDTTSNFERPVHFPSFLPSDLHLLPKRWVLLRWGLEICSCDSNSMNSLTLHLAKSRQQLPFGKRNRGLMWTWPCKYWCGCKRFQGPRKLRPTDKVKSGWAEGCTISPLSKILTNLSSCLSLAARKLCFKSRPISTTEDSMAFILCFKITSVILLIFSFILFSTLTFFYPGIITVLILYYVSLQTTLDLFRHSSNKCNSKCQSGSFPEWTPKRNKS